MYLLRRKGFTVKSLLLFLALSTLRLDSVAAAEDGAPIEVRGGGLTAKLSAGGRIISAKLGEKSLATHVDRGNHFGRLPAGRQNSRQNPCQRRRVRQSRSCTRPPRAAACSSSDSCRPRRASAGRSRSAARADHGPRISPPGCNIPTPETPASGPHGPIRISTTAGKTRSSSAPLPTGCGTTTAARASQIWWPCRS